MGLPRLSTLRPCGAGPDDLHVLQLQHCAQAVSQAFRSKCWAHFWFPIVSIHAPMCGNQKQLRQLFPSFYSGSRSS